MPSPKFFPSDADVKLAKILEETHRAAEDLRKGLAQNTASGEQSSIIENVADLRSQVPKTSSALSALPIIRF